MLNEIKSSFGGKIKIALSILILFTLFLSSSSLAQDNDKIKNGITKVYAMFTSNNYEGIDNYIESSYVEHTPSQNQKQGLDGLVNAIKSMKKGFPDLKFTINDIIISGDKAAVLCTLEGTNTGEFMGIPATNKKINVMGIDWLLFDKDNKCAEHWGYTDNISMLQQLGLMK